MTTRERVKQLRQTLKLPQTKFAERIGVSAAYLSEIELTDKPVNARIIRLISVEFGVSEYWLRTGEGDMYDKSEELDVIKVTSLFKLLNPLYREFVIGQLDALVNLQNASKEQPPK